MGCFVCVDWFKIFPLKNQKQSVSLGPRLGGKVKKCVSLLACGGDNVLLLVFYHVFMLLCWYFIVLVF